MTTYTTVDDFLRDDDFIRYTLDCEPDPMGRWAQYLNVSNKMRQTFLQATEILLHLDDCHVLSPEQVAKLKQRIQRTIAKTNKNYTKLQ